MSTESGDRQRCDCSDSANVGAMENVSNNDNERNEEIIINDPLAEVCTPIIINIIDVRHRIQYNITIKRIQTPINLRIFFKN